LLRLGIRGDVKILRRAPEQKIAHTAAHQNAAKPACCSWATILCAMVFGKSAIIYDLRYTIYAAICQSTRQSQSYIVNLFFAPDAFQMRDAAGHGVERNLGAQFKNFDVLWFLQTA